MFAVIKTGGKQYRAQEGDILQIEKIDYKEGQKVTFSQVLLVEDDGKTLIGTPFVENAAVSAVVVENFKDKKVVVFKKKRRKRYRKTRGHRQELTKVKIEQIMTGKAPAAGKQKEAAEQASQKSAAETTAQTKAKKDEAASVQKAAEKTGAKTTKKAAQSKSGKTAVSGQKRTGGKGSSAKE
ncbi:MAG: 50S ribosomal protein L21 [Candidatus Aminicenantaceae bacterium]